MNDALQILGVMAIAIVLTFSLAGKSPRDAIADARAANQAAEVNGSPRLSIADYVPPAWIGNGTTTQTNTNTNTVIDGNSNTNSGTALVSNTVNTKERSSFINSASNDDTNGQIIIATKNTPQVIATASATQANLSGVGNGQGMSYPVLLLIVVMLMMLVSLVHLTGNKKKRLRYSHSRGNFTPNRTQNFSNINYNYANPQYRY